MVLFIDDEARYVDSYVQELKLLGYDVQFQDCREGVETALEFFEENAHEVELLILDIIMPPGFAFQDDNTELGLRTGIAFFDQARSVRPDLPVIVLSNVTKEQVGDRFASEENFLYVGKDDCYPFELSARIDRMLNSSSR